MARVDHILASYLGLVIMVIFTAAGGSHMFGITRGGADIKSVRRQWWSTRLPLSSSTSLSPPENENCSSFVTKRISFYPNYISTASEYFATLKMTRQLPPPLGRPCIKEPS